MAIKIKYYNATDYIRERNERRKARGTSNLQSI